MTGQGGEEGGHSATRARRGREPVPASRQATGQTLAEELFRARVAPPPLFEVGDLTVSRVPPATPANPPVVGRRAGPTPPDPSARRQMLSQVAHARLGRSATRLDEALDAAAREGLTIEAAIARVRRLSIRGVLPGTLNSLADEMSQAYTSFAAGGNRAPWSSR